MRKEINIKVTGTHRELQGGDEHEAIENVYPATYIQKDGCHYLFYEEVQEGFGQIQNKVIVNPEGHVYMTKKGVITSDMVFTIGKSHTCDYKTPFSTVEINLHTESLDVAVAKDSISIAVTYLMDLDNEPYSRSTVEIHSI